jgi:hypothetical protein
VGPPTNPYMKHASTGEIMPPEPIESQVLPHSLRQEYLNQFCVTRRTIETIREIQPTIWPAVERSVARFYEHISGTSYGANLFFDNEAINRAKSGMLLHWGRILSARYDDEYFNAVHRIGSRHFELGIENHIYMSAYTRMVSAIALTLHEEQDVTLLELDALNKVVALDSQLTISAYIGALKSHKRADPVQR